MCCWTFGRRGAARAVREFPTLRRVYARYKEHGLTIIGVNLDSELSLAVDAANRAKLTYPHVFDGLGWKNAVALLYRVHGIPQIYLLDSQLKIVAKNLARARTGTAAARIARPRRRRGRPGRRSGDVANRWNGEIAAPLW